jgi:hypothetical protein
MGEFFTVFLVGERHQKMESDIINMVCLVAQDSSSSSLVRLNYSMKSALARLISRESHHHQPNFQIICMRSTSESQKNKSSQGDDEPN